MTLDVPVYNGYFLFQLSTGINARIFNDETEYVQEIRTSNDLANVFRRVSEEDGDEDAREALYPAYIGKWSKIECADSRLVFSDYYFTFCDEWAPAGKLLHRSINVNV